MLSTKDEYKVSFEQFKKLHERTNRSGAEHDLFWEGVNVTPNEKLKGAPLAARLLER
jgi:hypothetical protein